MNTKPIKPVAKLSRARSVVIVLGICCSFAVIAAGSSSARASGSHVRAAQSSLTGAWSGNYSGAYHGTFTLQWTQSGSKLSGTIKLSARTAAPRSPSRGLCAAAPSASAPSAPPAITYSGSVSGKSMSGTYKTPGGGGTLERPQDVLTLWTAAAGGPTTTDWGLDASGLQSVVIYDCQAMPDDYLKELDHTMLTEAWHNASVAAVVFDQNRTFVAVNTAYLDLVGYSRTRSTRGGPGWCRKIYVH